VVKESEWRPWGFDDFESISEISEEVLSAAMQALKACSNAQRDVLRTSFRDVATSYWRTRREIERPGPKWYRQQIKPVQKATARLLSLLREPALGTGRAALVSLTKLRLHRSLRGSTEPESIEQLLEGLNNVCNECLRFKGSAGAKEQSHVEGSVRELTARWRKLTGKRMSLSLDTDIGPSKRQQFTSPGCLFVQIIMQAIDPRLTTSEIATALRKALGKKSGAKIGKSSSLKSA
jgi:hypothetical protein